MSAPGERIQILEERVKELGDRLRASDAKLNASRGQERLRISEEKIKVLENKIKELEKIIKDLDNELDSCLLTKQTSQPRVRRKRVDDRLRPSRDIRTKEYLSVPLNMILF